LDLGQTRGRLPLPDRTRALPASSPHAQELAAVIELDVSVGIDPEKSVTVQGWC
jgi:hypothetical protein